MLVSSSLRRYLSFLALSAALIVLQTSPVLAQAQTFDRVNETILKQFASVPAFYKQVTVVLGIVSVLAGLHGFYKGLTDGRNPGLQWKKLYLILIGSFLLYIGSVGLTAQASIFGKSGAASDLTWTSTTKNIEVFRN